MTMTFGEIVADARKKLGVSQKELASRIKREDGKPISPQYLNDIERDRRNPPAQYLIVQLAKELKLPQDYLVLAAGSLPKEIEERVRMSHSAPEGFEEVEKAFQVFRRGIKK